MRNKFQSAIWCRVSSKEQEETGYSLPSQEKLLKNYTQKIGIHNSKVFSVSESAKGGNNRQNFQEMMRWVKDNKVDLIIVEKIDRLTRSIKDAVIVDEWVKESDEHQVHFVKENFILSKDSPSHQIFQWNIKVSVSQFYINNLSEEVKKGQLAKLENGWLPTIPPYGYITIGLQGHKTHVIDEDVAPLVKKLFKEYSKGTYSLKKLTVKANQLGLKTTKGNNVVKSGIHMMLKKKFYIGINTWKGVDYIGKQETFISKELFDKVQDVLKGGSNKPPTFSRHNYLFKGLLNCRHCSGTITWEAQKGIVYGHCNHYKPCPTKKWARQDDVQKGIAKSLKPLVIKNKKLLNWLRDELKNRVHEETDTQLTSLKQLQESLQNTEKAKERLYDDKLYGNISDELYKRKDKELSEKVNRVKENIDNVSENTESARKKGLNLFDLAQGGHTVFNKADKEKKQELIKLVFKQISLYEDEVFPEFTDDMKLLLKAVEQTNRSKLMKKVLILENTFEPKEKIDLAIKSSDFLPLRSELLPG